MNKKYYKYIFRQFLIWSVAFVFWSLMRRFGHEIVLDIPEPPTFLQELKIHLALGLVAGLLFGTLEYIIDKLVYKRLSLGKVILIGSTSYLLTTISLIFFGSRIFMRVLDLPVNWNSYQRLVDSNEIYLLIFYCFLVGFIYDLIKQVDKKLGPGNLWKMLKGEFYNPKEDERIFMFLDLKSSTTIAEQLGHIQYSKLIQDCFQDLEVVEKYHTEIYQYVGDEAVLTWKKEIGLLNSNCLRAFFDFQQKLSDKSGYYNTKYGLVPKFKAGLNIGKITIAEVGQIKTEIAYHGDTINTASRIQSQCNSLGRTILISEELKNNLLDIKDFSSVHVGDILLKGKAKKVNIYSVEAHQN